MQMVDFRIDPSKSFAYPITEIATMKFQEGSTKEQMDAVLHSFMDLQPKISRELDLAGDNYPKYFAWGEMEGVPYTYCFSLGWDSLEVRVSIFEARWTSAVKVVLRMASWSQTTSQHHRNIGKRYAKEAWKHVDNLSLVTEADIRHATLTSY